MLVAPIWDSKENLTSRQVWIPPGSWEDAWDGSIAAGPRYINVTQPFERQPMWYRRDGGLLALAGQPMARVEEQDWSTLTLEAFPALHPETTHRSIFEQVTSKRTDIKLTTSSAGQVELHIGNSGPGLSRAWVVRVHLHPGYEARDIVADGENLRGRRLHASPESSHEFFPFGGPGTAPALNSGSIVEIHLSSSGHARFVKMTMFDTNEIIV